MGRYKLAAAVTLSSFVATMISLVTQEGGFFYVLLLLWIGGSAVWLFQLGRAGPPANEKARWWRIVVISLLMAPWSAYFAMVIWLVLPLVLTPSRPDDTWLDAMALTIPFLATAPFAWKAYKTAFARAHWVKR